MSRAIKINVSESVTEVVCADDEVRQGIAILPLLPPEPTKRNLGETLREHGFEPQQDGSWSRTDPDGVTIRVTVEERDGKLEASVSASISESEEITETGDGVAHGYDDTENSHAVQRAKQKLREELKGKIEKERDKRQKRITKTLRDKQSSLREELGEIGNKTNIKNLQQKARSMGEVVEEQQSDQGVTIRVKL